MGGNKAGNTVDADVVEEQSGSDLFKSEDEAVEEGEVHLLENPLEDCWV
jgi:hypothetical protein